MYATSHTKNDTQTQKEPSTNVSEAHNVTSTYTPATTSISEKAPTQDGLSPAEVTKIIQTLRKEILLGPQLSFILMNIESGILADEATDKIRNEFEEAQQSMVRFLKRTMPSGIPVAIWNKLTLKDKPLKNFLTPYLVGAYTPPTHEQETVESAHHEETSPSHEATTIVAETTNETVTAAEKASDHVARQEAETTAEEQAALIVKVLFPLIKSITRYITSSGEYDLSQGPVKEKFDFVEGIAKDFFAKNMNTGISDMAWELILKNKTLEVEKLPVQQALSNFLASYRTGRYTPSIDTSSEQSSALTIPQLYKRMESHEVDIAAPLKKAWDEMMRMAKHTIQLSYNRHYQELTTKRIELQRRNIEDNFASYDQPSTLAENKVTDYSIPQAIQLMAFTTQLPPDNKKAIMGEFTKAMQKSLRDNMQDIIESAPFIVEPNGEFFIHDTPIANSSLIGTNREKSISEYGIAFQLLLTQIGTATPDYFALAEPFEYEVGEFHKSMTLATSENDQRKEIYTILQSWTELEIDATQQIDSVNLSHAIEKHFQGKPNIFSAFWAALGSRITRQKSIFKDPSNMPTGDSLLSQTMAFCQMLNANTNDNSERQQLQDSVKEVLGETCNPEDKTALPSLISTRFNTGGDPFGAFAEEVKRRLPNDHSFRKKPRVIPSIREASEAVIKVFFPKLDPEYKEYLVSAVQKTYKKDFIHHTQEKLEQTQKQYNDILIELDSLNRFERDGTIAMLILDLYQPKFSLKSEQLASVSQEIACATKETTGESVITATTPNLDALSDEEAERIIQTLKKEIRLSMTLCLNLINIQGGTLPDEATDTIRNEFEEAQQSMARFLKRTMPSGIPVVIWNKLTLKDKPLKNFLTPYLVGTYTPPTSQQPTAEAEQDTAPKKTKQQLESELTEAVAQRKISLEHDVETNKHLDDLIKKLNISSNSNIKAYVSEAKTLLSLDSQWGTEYTNNKELAQALTRLLSHRKEALEKDQKATIELDTLIRELREPTSTVSPAILTSQLETILSLEKQWGVLFKGIQTKKADAQSRLNDTASKIALNVQTLKRLESPDYQEDRSLAAVSLLENATSVNIEQNDNPSRALLINKFMRKLTVDTHNRPRNLTPEERITSVKTILALTLVLELQAPLLKRMNTAIKEKPWYKTYEKTLALKYTITQIEKAITAADTAVTLLSRDAKALNDECAAKRREGLTWPELVEYIAHTARTSPQRQAFVIAINTLLGVKLETSFNPTTLNAAKLEMNAAITDEHQFLTALKAQMGNHYPVTVIPRGIEEELTKLQEERAQLFLSDGNEAKLAAIAARESLLYVEVSKKRREGLSWDELCALIASKEDGNEQKQAFITAIDVLLNLRLESVFTPESLATATTTLDEAISTTYKQANSKEVFLTALKEEMGQHYPLAALPIELQAKIKGFKIKLLTSQQLTGNQHPESPYVQQYKEIYSDIALAENEVTYISSDGREQIDELAITLQGLVKEKKNLEQLRITLEGNTQSAEEAAEKYADLALDYMNKLIDVVEKTIGIVIENRNITSQLDEIKPFVENMLNQGYLDEQDMTAWREAWNNAFYPQQQQAAKPSAPNSPAPSSKVQTPVHRTPLKSPIKSPVRSLFMN